MNYNQYENLQSKNSSQEGNKPYVGYLSLKEGEEAIVRVMCSSVEDLDILPLHWAFVDGRESWVKCNREPQDPIDNCPLCKAEKPLSYRVFIKVIQYVVGEDGKLKALAKIWDRPASFVSILKDRIADYGPLSEMVCKVKRHGSGKSTTYDLMPLSSERYPENIYVKRENAFEGFNIIGHSVREIKEEQNSTQISAQDNPQMREDKSLPWENIPNTPQNVSQEAYQAPQPQTFSRYSGTTQNNNQNPFGRPQRFNQN